MTLHHHALEAPQRPGPNPHRLPRLEPGLGRERLVGVDETFDRPQVGDEGRLVGDREPAGDRVCGQGGPPLIVVDQREDIAWKKRDMRKSRAAPCRV